MDDSIPHGSIEIGQLFIKKARDESRFFTPMQVLKLAYIAHGFMLGIHGKPLIGEPVEVWPYGPVFSILYHRIKGYRSTPITADIDAGIEAAKLSSEEDSIIKQTYEIYKNYSGVELSSMTHKTGTPWHDSNAQELSHIPNEYIKSYYEELAKSSR